MKCQVLRDKNGSVLAIGYGTHQEIEVEGMLTRFGPVSEEDQTIVELNIADEYAELQSDAVMQHVQAQLASSS